MEIYDISMTIKRDMPVYKGKKEKKLNITVISDFDNSSTHNTEISMNVHTGTHVDAPLHMLAGELSIEEFNSELFINPSHVLDLTGVKDSIKRADLEGCNLREGEFILFKTKNSSEDYLEKRPQGFIYLAADAAKYLVEIGVKGVGIDALGVERDQPGYPTHKELLNNQVCILEGLCLSSVSEGDYKSFLAPLKISGSDGAPARAILIKE